MKNILLVLISFVIIGCSNAVYLVTNTVELSSIEDSNDINFTEAKSMYNLLSWVYWSFWKYTNN